MPSIENKRVLMLVVLTDSFECFTSDNELCNYAGLTLVIRQSGSSVNGGNRISKIRNQKF
nr:transposase [uncultured Formosa sp.]